MQNTFTYSQARGKNYFMMLYRLLSRKYPHGYRLIHGKDTEEINLWSCY